MLHVQCLKMLQENEVLTLKEEMLWLLIKCLHPSSSYLFLYLIKEIMAITDALCQVL
jgi:hypothetical protein